jgi:hypothetical protein
LPSFLVLRLVDIGLREQDIDGSCRGPCERKWVNVMRCVPGELLHDRNVGRKPKRLTARTPERAERSCREVASLAGRNGAGEAVRTEWAYYDVEDTWYVGQKTEPGALPFWCVQWKEGPGY